jgi:hypothetical protein
MDLLFLNSLNTQTLKFLVEDLAQIHDDGLVNLLPQMGPENLNQGYLERWNLAVQKDTGQIQLYLETNIYVGSVNSRAPPQGEATIRDLIQPRSLGVSQLLELHAFFESGSLLPKETPPSWGMLSSFEKCVFKNGLDSSQGLDDICAIGVQIP